MIDKSAFRALSYGLYIVSSEAEGRKAGCVVNTFAQVTSSPAQVSVALNKENATTSVIDERGAFEVCVLDESATMELIGGFGFHSSKDADKFAGVSTAVSERGLPYVTEHVCAHFSVKVSQRIDVGSHVLFIGEVVSCETLGQEKPMTYAFYHEVKGGTTPPKASSYNGPAVSAPSKAAARVAWRCKVCGHIEYVDELPDDFTCPLCGVGKDMFERIEL